MFISTECEEMLVPLSRPQMLQRRVETLTHTRVEYGPFPMSGGTGQRTSLFHVRRWARAPACGPVDTVYVPSLVPKPPQT